jgi:hypothetical protein
MVYTYVKYQGKIPLNNQYTLKNEGQEGKTGTVWGRILVVGERVNGEGEEGQIWSTYLLHVYENRTMKLF